MTVPAPDALRAEIDRRLAELVNEDTTRHSMGMPSYGHYTRERVYLAAFRAILAGP